MTKGKTLAELDVKPGDVVEFIGDAHSPTKALSTIQGWVYGRCYAEGQELGASESLRRAAVFTIVSRANEPTEDKPKTWGEMTDAEKGAIALANLNGEAIEILDDGDWITTTFIYQDSDEAYRIRKEPVRETVTLWRRKFGWYGNDGLCSDNTHTVTFPTLDGELIPGTYTNEAGDKIVMEIL